LIDVRGDETVRVAERLAEASGVSEVYSVAGTYDLVAVLRVENNAALADLVTQCIRRMPGITRMETLIAFRSCSRRDVEGLLPMD
jgi:DNA-binding Lrp family transcriptional regulator